MVKAKTANTAKENNLFCYIIALVCLDLFFFHLWLFYPGYIETDCAMMVAYLGLDNHYPVIYPFLLQYVFQVFGKHLYILLALNLIPLYLGIYVLMLGCWKRFHSAWCLLAVLPLCIGNIYFNNIILHNSFASPMLIFLVWMLVLYQILVGITYKNSIALILSFILAVTSRHNAIIQVYPIFFVYAYFIMRKLNTKYKLSQYIGLLVVFAILTIGVSLGVPNLIKTGQKPISTPIFLHQIAGVCVPHHDETCFKPEWYIPGKTYKDVERTYNAEPLNTDYMSVPWKENCPFRHELLPELKKFWLKAILKYPYDYCKYGLRFIKVLWATSTMTDMRLDDPHYSPYITNLSWLKTIFPAEELFYKPQLIKIKIYDFLYSVFPKIRTIDYIALNFILFFVLSVLFLKRKNVFLLYACSSSLAGIGSSVMFSIFTADIVWRYMYPILISTTVAVIGAIIYLIDKRHLKEQK